jgi:hypothetical protein
MRTDEPDPGSIMDCLDHYYDTHGWYDHWKDNSKTVFTRRDEDGILRDHHPNGSVFEQGDGPRGAWPTCLIFGAALLITVGCMALSLAVLR